METIAEGNENTGEQKFLDLKSTPKRVSEMLTGEMLAYPPAPEFKTFRIQRARASVIAIGPLDVSSICAHHMLPFVGKAWVAYLPDERIIGLSKPARLLDYYASRFQIQERLTSQVLDHLVKVLTPKACLVVIRAHHGCMGCRGVKQGDAQTVTQALYPPDGLPPETQDELYRAIDRC